MPAIPPIALCLALIAVFLRLLASPFHSNNVFVEPSPLHDVLLPKDSHISSARILLLTAHPDDECFFFGPTLNALLSQENQSGKNDDSFYAAPRVYSLCLSVGDADGLGELRRNEFGKSWDVMGIPEDRRWLLDHDELKDNITAKWNPTLIADVVRPYVVENKISTILTFDRKGISSHPNHYSLFYGVSHLLSSFPVNPETPSSLIYPRPRAYSLITLPTITKYTSVTAPLLAKLDLYFYRFLERFNLQPKPSGPRGATVTATKMPVFVASSSDYARTAKAIMQHESQLVWFRWLYMAFSRYMWVNEWVEIPAGIKMK